MSRTVTAHLFSSVNGVVEGPDQFQFDAMGEAEVAFMVQAITGVDDVVIGRKLWSEWSEYWPGAEDPFGQFINPVRKHVISSTLQGDLGWNSTLVEGDPVAYVEQLKSAPGGGIVVTGGVETVRSLFLAGVVDALTFTVHPVATNAGRRLFDESVPLTRLRLADSSITPAGNAILTYALREND